jgi:hypothetical protein
LKKLQVTTSMSQQQKENEKYGKQRTQCAFRCLK